MISKAQRRALLQRRHHRGGPGGHEGAQVLHPGRLPPALARGGGGLVGASALGIVWAIPMVVGTFFYQDVGTYTQGLRPHTELACAYLHTPSKGAGVYQIATILAAHVRVPRFLKTRVKMLSDVRAACALPPRVFILIHRSLLLMLMYTLYLSEAVRTRFSPTGTRPGPVRVCIPGVHRRPPRRPVGGRGALVPHGRGLQVHRRREHGVGRGMAVCDPSATFEQLVCRHTLTTRSRKRSV